MDAPDLFSNCLSTKYLDCGLLGAVSWWEVSLTLVPPNNQNPVSYPRPSVSWGQATHSFWRCFKKSKKHLALKYQHTFNFLFNFKSIFIDHPFNFYPKTYRLTESFESLKTEVSLMYFTTRKTILFKSVLNFRDHFLLV